MDISLEFTGERVVPWAKDQKDHTYVVRDHVARYNFALPHVGNKVVRDLGSGTGYGTFMLSWLADKVYGYDVAEAVRFASDNFKADNLKFYEKDLMELKVPKCDVIVCFEVLEHLDDPMAIINQFGVASTVFYSLPVNDPGKFHKHIYDVKSAEALVPGAGIWYQSTEGYIIPKQLSNFQPKYIIGVLNK